MSLQCLGGVCHTVVRNAAEQAPPTSIIELPGWQGWCTLVLLVLGLVILFKDWARTEMVMMGILVILIWLQVLDVDTATAGFASPSILTVLVLLGMAEGISQTGALDAFFRKVLGRPTSCSAAIIRLALPVCFWSAFLNNTPVVALMIPILVTWSRAIKQPMSKLAIPLSYASELGGVCTLIGTSTNLVVKEKYDEARLADPSLPQLTIFSQARFGVPIALIGIIYIALFGWRLLPGTTTRERRAAEEEEPIQVGMLVTSLSPAVGRTVTQAGLTDMVDLKLTHIVRDGATLPLFQLAYQVINMYDELYITGDMTQIDALASQLLLKVVTDEYDHDPFSPSPSPSARRASARGAAANGGDDGAHTSLLQGAHASSSGAQRNGRMVRASLPGAQPHERFHSRDAWPSPDRPESPSHGGGSISLFAPSSGEGVNDSVGLIRLVHVTVREGAPVIGMTIKNARFRGRFDAAVVVIHRDFRRVPGAISEVVLESGDELMLDAGASFDAASADMRTNFEDVRYVKTPAKQFMMALEVPEGSDLVGKNLEEGGLRGMGNAYVVTVQRGAEKLHAVSPQVKLKARDVLWLTGNADAVHALRNRKDLQPIGPQVTSVAPINRELMQAVLSSNSPLLGKRAYDVDFAQFNVSLLAVHRSGSRLVTDMAEVHLRTGDVLLLEGDRNFVKQHEGDDGFALLTVLENSAPTKWNRSILALALLVLLIAAQVAQSILMTTPFVPLLALCAMVVFLMILTRCMSVAQLHKALRWDLYLTIAAAIGISKALESTRVASMIANLVITIGTEIGGNMSIMASMYVATALLSNIIANNAAAALLFPIMLDISRQRGIKLEYLTFLLMFGASSAFMTPYGYQTNLMVKDVGGYAPIHYLKVGAPFQLWQAVGTMLVMAAPEKWGVAWVVVAVISACAFAPILLSNTSAFRILRHHASASFSRRSNDVELHFPPAANGAHANGARPNGTNVNGGGASAGPVGTSYTQSTTVTVRI